MREVCFKYMTSYSAYLYLSVSVLSKMVAMPHVATYISK